MAKVGTGTRAQDGPPVGYRHHQWVAACNVMLKDDDEVAVFQQKALSDTKWGKHTTGTAMVNGPVEVLDVYCQRCRMQPGREPWCLRHPMRHMPR